MRKKAIEPARPDLWVAGLGVYIVRGCKLWHEFHQDSRDQSSQEFPMLLSQLELAKPSSQSVLAEVQLSSWWESVP